MRSWFTSPDRRGLGSGEVCDRCGIRASVRVILASGKEIYLCRHHARAHEDALKERRSRFHDLPN